MELQPSEFPDLVVSQIPRYDDNRGFFRLCSYRSAGNRTEFVQENESFSKAGVLRGMHFQHEPFEQGKLVRVISGRIQDIVIDLRPESPSFQHYCQVILDGSNQIYVPPGFAHGFLALEDSYVNYKCTEHYKPEFEGGIAWDDPDLNLPWEHKNWKIRPISPIISERDQKWPRLSEIRDKFKAAVE